MSNKTIKLLTGYKINIKCTISTKKVKRLDKELFNHLKNKMSLDPNYSENTTKKQLISLNAFKIQHLQRFIKEFQEKFILN